MIAESDAGTLEAWQPKDRDSRSIPVPTETIDLLTRMQAEAPEGSAYVFVAPERIEWVTAKRQAGTWTEGQDVLNNLDRDLKRIANAARVKDVSLHDLRRSCISNWARKLPTPVVQQLAGHADIKTTMRYYISVREHDLQRARDVASEALACANVAPTSLL